MYVNAVTLDLTNNCNLGCSYCFERQKPNTKMSLEVAQKTVDWLLKDSISGPMSHVDITFFGGEPLIEFENIKKIVGYARRKAEEVGKTVGFNATSNGTLFTEDVAKFWKENEIGLLLSCDGVPHAHDAHRITRRGGGSFKLLERNLDYILGVAKAKQVRMTVMPDTTKYMKEGVQFLADLGFDSIAVFEVEEVEWTKEQLLEYQEQFYQVGEFYAEAIEKGRNLAIEPLDRYIKAQLNEDSPNNQDESPCGAGRGYIGIAADGTLYPCHRFFSANNFQGAFPIGHIDTGFDERKRMPFLRVKRGLMMGCDVDCNNCPAHNCCSGGCMAANYEVTGHLLMRPPTARYFEIIWKNVANSIVDYFKQRKFEKLEERFSQKSIKECSQDLIK